MSHKQPGLSKWVLKTYFLGLLKTKKNLKKSEF